MKVDVIVEEWDTETMRAKAAGTDRGASWVVYHDTSKSRRLYHVRWAGGHSIPMFLLRDARIARDLGYSVVFVYNDVRVPECKWTIHLDDNAGASLLGSFGGAYAAASCQWSHE